MLDAVLAIADETGASAIQVSLAWLTQRAAAAQTALITILGPRSFEQLGEYLGSLDLELDDQQYQRLDEISAVSLGTPHDDVAAALKQGFDGNRAELRSALLPVV